MIKLRFFDWAAVGINCVVILFFSWHAFARVGGEPVVYIQGESNAWVFPLDENREISIPGPLGNTRIIVREGETYVEDSPCRDKLCIYFGRIARAGNWIACLPNRVFIRIESKTEADVDATVF